MKSGSRLPTSDLCLGTHILAVLATQYAYLPQIEIIFCALFLTTLKMASHTPYQLFKSELSWESLSDQSTIVEILPEVIESTFDTFEIPSKVIESQMDNFLKISGFQWFLCICCLLSSPLFVLIAGTLSQEKMSKPIHFPLRL